MQTIHAICDLGLLITKRLVSDVTEVSGFDAVPLPCKLYKPVDKSMDEDIMVSISWLNIFQSFPRKLLAERLLFWILVILHTIYLAAISYSDFLVD